MILDTLALGAIAIGVVAAIGVAFVAMSDSGAEKAPTVSAQAEAEPATVAVAAVQSGVPPATVPAQQPPPPTPTASTVTVQVGPQQWSPVPPSPATLAAAAQPEAPAWQQVPVPQPVPVPDAPAPRAEHNGYHNGTTTTFTSDPLLTGFLQMVMAELEDLRKQQHEIQRRLTLIDGIAVLIEEMHANTVNGSQPPSTTHRAEPRRSTPARTHRS